MKFKGKILLVDDEAHIRKYVGLILKQLGLTSLLEAANGEEALELFARERPALVLLDVNMPVMDGMQTLKRLREIDPGCVVIMLTSLANRQTVEESLALGAVNYLRKDISKEEIAQSISQTIAESFGDSEQP